MSRAAFVCLAVALSAAIVWQSAPAWQAATEPSAPAPAPRPTPPAPTTATSAAPGGTAAPSPAQPAQPPAVRAVTPMAERVATIGLLNKRNGLWRDLTLKPGQAVRIGDVVVRLKACETTAPWEAEAYTGAFVQLIVLGSDEKWRKIFSGWLFKESPSLNLVEHPIYDVWTKACTMRHPDTGPETLVVRGGESRGSGDRSNARKSAPPPPDSAEDNSTI